MQQTLLVLKLRSCLHSAASVNPGTKKRPHHSNHQQPALSAAVSAVYMTHNGQVDYIHSPFSQISHSMNGMCVSMRLPVVKEVGV